MTTTADAATAARADAARADAARAVVVPDRRIAVAPAPTARLPRASRRASLLRERSHDRTGLRGLHPSVSFCYALTLAFAALALSDPLQAATVLLVILVSLAASRRLRAASPYIRIALYVGLVIVIVNPLLTPGGIDVLWSCTAGPLTVRLSIQSLAYGIASALRLTGVVLAFALFNAVVDADDQLAIMSRLSFRSGLVLSLASRLLPVFSRDAARITDAQRSRGVPLDRGRRRERAAARLPLLACLLTQSLERAVDVAASMESRGYGAGRRSRWSQQRRWRPADTVALVATLATASVLLGGLASGAFSYTFFPLLDDPWPPLLSATWLAVLSGLCLPLIVTRPWRPWRHSSR